MMPEIAVLFRACFDHTYPTFPILHTSKEDLHYFSSVIFPKDTIYICKEDEKIAGFIAFNDEWIDHLYIDPAVQGEGIGSKLLAIACEGKTHLQLWTFQENHRARAFYERYGFEAVRFTDGDNEEGQPDVLYEWKA